MKVLYIDSLFVLEWLADLLLLWSAGKLCGAVRRSWRLLLGGMFGALYALGAVFLPELERTIPRLVSLLLMLLIAYGGMRGLGRLVLAFLCMCAVFAGVTTAVRTAAGAASARALLFSFGISLGLCTLPFRFSGRKGGVCQLRLWSESGDEVQLRALRDTGNSLREPISGAPAVLAAESLLLPLLPPEQQLLLRQTSSLSAEERMRFLGRGYRLLPYHSVNGAGLLLAFRVAEAEVDGQPLGICWAALSPQPIHTPEGCCALVSGDATGEKGEHL